MWARQLELFGFRGVHLAPAKRDSRTPLLLFWCENGGTAHHDPVVIVCLHSSPGAAAEDEGVALDGQL